MKGNLSRRGYYFIFVACVLSIGLIYINAENTGAPEKLVAVVIRYDTKGFGRYLLFRRLYVTVKLPSGENQNIWWPDIPKARVGTMIPVELRRRKYLLPDKYALDRKLYGSEI